MALAEGPRSTIWTELRPAIPSVTFARLTSYAGVEAKVTASWEDLCQLFNSDLELKRKTGERAKQTVENYQRTLSRFGTFLAERQISRLQDLNRSIIDEFCSWRIDQVKSAQSLGGQPSLYFDLCQLHRVGAFACERGLLEKNRFPTPKRPPLKRHNSRPFSADELARMENVAQREPGHPQLFPCGDEWLPFWLFRGTGFRPEDAISVLWQAVDFQAQKIVHVCHKNHKEVSIPLLPGDQLRVRLEAEYRRRKPLPTEPVLLNADTGRALTYDQIYGLIMKLGELAGVPDANPYRFRGTFAVDMLLRTNNPFYVAKLLGDTMRIVERHYTPCVRELQEHNRLILERNIGLSQFVTVASQS